MWDLVIYYKYIVLLYHINERKNIPHRYSKKKKMSFMKINISQEELGVGEVT